MTHYSFYKRFPGDLIGGICGLTFEQRGAYGLIIDLIYMHGGRCPSDPHYIGGVLGCSTRQAGRLVAELVALGKLYRVAETLGNGRADRELLAISGPRVGKVPGKNSRKKPNIDQTLTKQEQLNDHETSENSDLSKQKDDVASMRGEQEQEQEINPPIKGGGLSEESKRGHGREDPPPGAVGVDRTGAKKLTPLEAAELCKDLGFGGPLAVLKGDFKN